MRGSQTPVRPPVVPAAVMPPPPHGPGGPVRPSRAPWLPLVAEGDPQPRPGAPLRPVPPRRARLGGEPRSPAGRRRRSPPLVAAPGPSARASRKAGSGCPANRAAWFCRCRSRHAAPRSSWAIGRGCSRASCPGRRGRQSSSTLVAPSSGSARRGAAPLPRPGLKPPVPARVRPGGRPSQPHCGQGARRGRRLGASGRGSLLPPSAAPARERRARQSSRWHPQTAQRRRSQVAGRAIRARPGHSFSRPDVARSVAGARRCESLAASAAGSSASLSSSSSLSRSLGVRSSSGGSTVQVAVGVEICQACAQMLWDLE